MVLRLFSQFPGKRFIVIGDYLFDVLERYLYAFAKAKYALVRAAGSGTCGGIGQALGLVPDGAPLMIVWSDLILPDDIAARLKSGGGEAGHGDRMESAAAATGADAAATATATACGEAGHGDRMESSGAGAVSAVAGSETGYGGRGEGAAAACSDAARCGYGESSGAVAIAAAAAEHARSGGRAAAISDGARMPALTKPSVNLSLPDFPELQDSSVLPDPLDLPAPSALSAPSAPLVSLELPPPSVPLNLPTPLAPPDLPNLIGISKDFPCRWSYAGGNFLEEPSSERGVAGLFAFRDKSGLAGVPDSGEFVRWLGQAGAKFADVGLSGAREVGTAEAYAREAGRSYRCRPFNALSFAGGRVAKTPISEQGEALARRERAWYREAAARGFSRIPRIYSYDPLEMEEVSGQNAFRGSRSDEEKKSLIVQIVGALSELHGLGAAPADAFSLQEAYYTKTMRRLDSVAGLIPYAGAPSVTVNGRDCRNPLRCRGELREKIMAELVEGAPPFALIHGDCTFSNIMAGGPRGAVLLDPRGYFGFTELRGDPRYDWAKLYYSIRGDYDQFNNGNFRLVIDGRRAELDIGTSGFRGLEGYFLDAIAELAGRAGSAGSAGGAGDRGHAGRAGSASGAGNRGLAGYAESAGGAGLAEYAGTTSGAGGAGHAGRAGSAGCAESATGRAVASFGATAKNIRLIHALIWLSLAAYAWEDYDSVCGAFYNGLYYLEECW
jgi:hypothetical protein